MEAVRLRIKDIDFARQELTVRDGSPREIRNESYLGVKGEL